MYKCGRHLFLGNLAGLLNKICPENVDSIIEKIAAIKVEDIKQLEAAVRTFRQFKRLKIHDLRES